MALPTTIERLNAHLIGFVRAYTFQLARGIEPQLPHAGEGVDVVGHQAALHAARAIVRTARDKLDVRRMLSAMESYLAGMGRDISEPFQRLIAELGDTSSGATPAEPTAPSVNEPSSSAVVEPAAVVAASEDADAGRSESHGSVESALVSAPVDTAQAAGEPVLEPVAVDEKPAADDLVKESEASTEERAANDEAEAQAPSSTPAAEADDQPASSESSTDLQG
ncbi:MAG: hypothetical protein JNJ46_30550 [Myxococcales bacterium]|nr:hypothetical protein [Myxococcales bacterium]